MEVIKIKTGRQKNMEAEKLIEALHTVEKLKRTMRHCYTSDDRKESVAEHCLRVAFLHKDKNAQSAEKRKQWS